MSSFENFLESIPEFAKDIKLNVKSIVLGESDILSKKQLAIIAVASAIATKHKILADMVRDHFNAHISEVEMNGAKIAATIMGMNNIYYRFVHLASNKDYSKMPAGLRMNALSSHGIDKVDFELASLAVSAINGCGMCIDSHENKLMQDGVTKEQIQLAIKIASVLHAITHIQM